MGISVCAIDEWPVFTLQGLGDEQMLRELESRVSQFIEALGGEIDGEALIAFSQAMPHGVERHCDHDLTLMETWRIRIQKFMASQLTPAQWLDPVLRARIRVEARSIAQDCLNEGAQDSRYLDA